MPRIAGSPWDWGLYLPSALPKTRQYPRPVNLPQKVAINTMLLALSRLVVAGSGLVGVAVSTRYLGPADFGQLTVAIVFVSVFGFFTDAGLYTVAVRELAKHPDDERRLLANVFSMGLVMTAVAVLVALAFTAALYGGSSSELIRVGIVILGVQMLASPLGGTASAYLVAHQRAGPTAFAGGLSSVVFVGSLVVVIELDLGFAGLAACFALSGLISLLVPFLFVRGLRLGFARDSALWGQMFRWAVPQAGVLVLGVLYFRVDTFLLSFLSSDAEVGRYAVAYRTLEVLVVIPAYLMATLFPEIARERPRSVRLSELVQAAFSAVVLAAVPLVIIFVVFAAEMIAVAGGPRYADAVTVLQILAMAVALLFVNTVFFQSLVALNRQGRLFVMLLTVLAGNVALNLLLVPPHGAVGAAISLVVTEAAALVLALRIFAEVGTAPRLRRPLRLIGAAASTSAVVFALRELLPIAQASQGIGNSFTAAFVPLGMLVGGAFVTIGLWAGALALFGAVPPEVRGALKALRRGATPDPVAVAPSGLE